MTFTHFLIIWIVASFAGTALWAFFNWRRTVREEMARAQFEQAKLDRDIRAYIHGWHIAEDYRLKAEKARKNRKRSSGYDKLHAAIKTDLLRREIDLRLRGVDLAGLFSEAL